MFGGALTCPPGFHCMDTTTVLVYALVIVAVAAIAVFALKYHGILDMGMGKKPAPPTVVVMQQKAPPQIQIQEPPMDPRFLPLSPERSYNIPADIRGFPTAPMPGGLGALPVNRLTRGYPEQYQQLGVLTTAGGTETSASPTRTILPLFGRTTDSSRNRWNYYTRTDGINPVQVPIQFKRRNCDDDNGCEEITDGDSVSVPIMGQAFQASIYRYATPRYLPL
jgi:hypothetical protein